VDKNTLKTVAAYLTIYIVWGSTYFFIKMALESFPPYSIVGSLAISAYAYLLVNEPSIRIVSYALVNPGIAVFLGFLFGNESAAPYLAIG
jgi:drug/metabolite transporter (DMT)-like permease